MIKAWFSAMTLILCGIKDTYLRKVLAKFQLCSIKFRGFRKVLIFYLFYIFPFSVLGPFKGKASASVLRDGRGPNDGRQAIALPSQRVAARKPLFAAGAWRSLPQRRHL